MAPITVEKLPSRAHRDANSEHHVGNPPASFKNPWPSFKEMTRSTIFKTRFGSHPEKKFIPVPQGANGSRSEQLVKVRKPDWGVLQKERLRATWIGHASFLVETPAEGPAERGVRVLFDPVFADKTGPRTPLGFVGPKRYSPTPCTITEVPDVDIVCISHNHYDHLDYEAVAELHRRRKDKIHFFVPMNDKAWFVKHVCSADQVTELDWWDSRAVNVDGIGSIKLTFTPSQHSSARTPFDKDCALWGSWALEAPSRKLFFAGDTAYQAVDTPGPCPVFKQIGEVFGSFDLALVPIGLFKPQNIMSCVHASPEQSLIIHKEVRSKLSIGMHYGTVRGGISGQYEEVTEPPRRWREVAEKEGLWRGGGIEGGSQSVDVTGDGVGLCDIGETVAV